jgi:hypothetical protein
MEKFRDLKNGEEVSAIKHADGKVIIKKVEITVMTV